MIDRTVLRNIWLLAACQGMLLCNAVTLIAVNGLAGRLLAPTPALAVHTPPEVLLVGQAETLQHRALRLAQLGQAGDRVALLAERDLEGLGEGGGAQQQGAEHQGLAPSSC